MTKDKIYTILMVFSMLLWGVAWTAGKVAAEHANTQVAAFWSYAVAVLAIVPVVWKMKTPLSTDALGFFYTFLGGALTALFNYFFFAGLSHGNAGYGGTIVTSLSPIITAFLVTLFLKTDITARQLLALALGTVGSMILLRIPTDGLAFLNPHTIYFVGCAIVWALVTIVAQSSSKRMDMMFYSMSVFAVSAVINFFFAIPHNPFEAYDATFWWVIIFIGLFPGVFATALYFISAGKVGAHKTALFMFIVPIGAMLSSWAVYGEVPTPLALVGAVLVFLAVLVSG